MKLSYLSKAHIPNGEAVLGSDIRSGIFELIQLEHPGFQASDYISLSELNHYRRLYLTTLIEQEKGELALIDRNVMEAIRNNSTLSEKIQEEEEALTFGDRLADKIASFGGSWTFITIFFSFLFIWMAINIFILVSKPFDPYPFILLNLILSCLAAIQAPIIMMSQNRQESKDRKRAEHDYQINLKAELEIKLLSEKMDHLLVHQNKKLLEIQEVQIDYLEDLLNKVKEKKA
ncbi:putative membrane protein [Algoriphagus boseongensis]|uniref:Putative membrane protein n=1 Tax=Algoriphagus boseongensis TaxID=1442587 RepID=A0A4V3D2B8_9BACT|nr:DUF1003 domain-containing protein [Algoriphagus boseongensis]TDQ18277.1 putative membrane protein [Algoriphagus boseongensis]